MTTTTLTTNPSPWPTDARARLERVAYQGRAMTRVSCVGGCPIAEHRPLVVAEMDAPRLAAARDAEHAAQSLRPASGVAA